jgi:hypothetical protein
MWWGVVVGAGCEAHGAGLHAVGAWGLRLLCKAVGAGERVIGAGVPFRPVILAHGFVFELLELAYLVVPAFEPLALVCLVSFVSLSIRLPFSFGPVVLVIGVIAVFGRAYVAVLMLVFVGIGFGRHLVGWSGTSTTRTLSHRCRGYRHRESCRWW